jgi:hypothetical protein
MHGRILKAQRVVNNNTNTKGPRHGKIIIGMHRCIQRRFRRIFDARRSSDNLHFKEIQKA